MCQFLIHSLIFINIIHCTNYFKLFHLFKIHSSHAPLLLSWVQVASQTPSIYSSFFSFSTIRVGSLLYTVDNHFHDCPIPAQKVWQQNLAGVTIFCLFCVRACADSTGESLEQLREVGGFEVDLSCLCGDMTAKDQLSKLLDQLMGQNRDGEVISLPPISSFYPPCYVIVCSSFETSCCLDIHSLHASCSC